MENDAFCSGRKKCVKLHATCDDAFDETKVIETLEKLKKLADIAWNEFPESIPVQNAFGSC